MSTLIATLGLVYGAPIEALQALGTWQLPLVISLLTMAEISMAGFVLARAGRSPLWALVLLIPYLHVIALWGFAYARWPAMERR